MAARLTPVGAVRAISAYSSRRPCSAEELLDQVLDEELPRYAEALHRLGQ